MSSRLPAAERRTQLLDVALGVFAERGFHVASMNDVADAAGVTKPVLYQHFRSKRALYLELLEEVGDRLIAEIEHATATAGGPRAQVEQGLAAYFNFAASERDAFKLLFGGGTRRDAEFAALVARVESSVAVVIAELMDVPGLSSADRLLLAHGIVGLAEGTSRYWMGTGSGLEPQHAAKAAADLAWKGLRGLQSEQ